MVTGDNMKPAYGGEEEIFLRKVVTPIYNVISQVPTKLVSSLHTQGYFWTPFSDFAKSLSLCSICGVCPSLSISLCVFNWIPGD